MTDDPFDSILRRDARYSRAAYVFVRDALRFRLAQIGEPRHVTPRELLDGVRDLARQQFGPLAKTVVADWGVTSTGDIGHIVFNMIDEELMGKTESDHISQFVDVYTFDEMFPADPGEVVVRRASDDDDEDE